MEAMKKNCQQGAKADRSTCGAAPA